MADDSSMSASQSQLSASTSTPLSPSKTCSKTYKKASQLYLTRRLQESLAALQPAITIAPSDDQHANGDAAAPPVAFASPTWRIKVWNLYITLLSSIVDLGPEEGKKLFGQKEWKAISSQVRDGGIWETVVTTGYKGLEGSVDAEVVYNLATLLLNHSPSQALNQHRLETYLSSYGQPNLDITEHLNSSSSRRPAGGPGADTPKDLASRVRIIELFTLHVLPRNEEWEYASEFINLSEVLDDERKEVFLQTLDSLQEEKQQGELRAAALQREKDAEMERQARDAERQREEEEAAAAAAAAERAAQQAKHARSNSEVDYGIERTRRNGTVKGRGKTRSAFSPPAGAAKNVKKSDKSEASSSSRARQTRALGSALRTLFQYFSKTVAGSPLSFARTLLFLLGLLVALSRQDVRERLRRIAGNGWQKVKGTIGMGVKVSYI
ncbi:peroxin 26 [Aspergillus ambiguus]|uniref:protein pex26 n=1 Tax=Aspergillus ambiguus TaxID=176160 RepID=UPI003CCD25E3